MQDIHSQVNALKRPQLLVRAARFGLDEYRRNIHLRRAIRTDAIPGSGSALIQLLEIEREMNTIRIAKSGNYSIARHVEVLIAIMGEARHLRATTPRLVTS